MNRSSIRRRLPALVAGVAFLIMAAPPAALAMPPPNDSFAAAQDVSAFPFSDSVENGEATTEFGEPQACFFMPQTVWYVIRPTTDVLLRASMSRSNFSLTNFNIYRGASLGNLSFVNCAAFGNTLTFNAQGGSTYYIQAGSIFGAAGALRLDIEQILPPPNDDFAAATAIPSLPFSNRADTTAATSEPNEPTPSCGFGNLTGSVWYSFTPDTSISVSARATSPFISTAVAVYTGSSLGGLTELKCRNFSGLMTFRAEAGTTYYLQAGGLFGSRGPIDFRLSVAPDPVAAFVFGPPDPSMFEGVQFFNSSFDPGEVGIESTSWDFGDGGVDTGCCPVHRYGADGDYTARLTATTFDGRSASVDQLVHVQTHDVAVMRFAAPETGASGRTKQLSVDVRNTRYDERVEVQLLKSIPGGFEVVGTLMQFVPVRETGRGVTFSFNYTFTPDDAIVGKVTFKAVATILGARDALPADNDAIASPTRVNR
jgi:PKD repeat protein